MTFQGRISRLPLLVLLALAALGCDKKPDAAPETPAATTTSGTPAAGTTPAAIAATAPPGAKESAPTPGAAAVADAGLVVQGNGKTVILSDGGSDLNLKNQKGTGSVTTGSGGTTVTGKSGKSITIPGMGQ